MNVFGEYHTNDLKSALFGIPKAMSVTIPYFSQSSGKYCCDRVLTESGNGLTALVEFTIWLSRPGCGNIATSGGLPLCTRTTIWASNSLLPRS